MRNRSAPATRREIDRYTANARSCFRAVHCRVATAAVPVGCDDGSHDRAGESSRSGIAHERVEGLEFEGTPAGEPPTPPTYFLLWVVKKMVDLLSRLHRKTVGGVGGLEVLHRNL